MLMYDRTKISAVNEIFSAVVYRPRLILTVEKQSFLDTPIACNTCDGSIVPDVHADPVPSINWGMFSRNASASTPGNVTLDVLGNRSVVNWDKYMLHYDQIRNDIEKTIPGFEKYNERVRHPGGFYLPNGNRDGKFLTNSKKAAFSVSVFSPFPLKDDELLMMTIRSHDQFNTTIYGLNDRYRGIKNERRVLMMNRQDMDQRGLKTEDIVDISNNHGDINRIVRKFLVIPYPIPKGSAAMYFPEANVLVPVGSVADKSNTPTSKAVAIRVMKSSEKY